ncbi:alpha/beta hydrolase family esterase [Aquabacterium sp. J223]|uniref:extracellular catalytic domain type 1 short-chain-length polyhydroxyalkanoate depolymerase n=1 Tax=Aquabacterium sp. J223 TaxID=2898431 RepID=UPI0021ADD9F9|nr:PHB depolymerase family esterase [Aquabacterium sp. J223]UUX95938.1 PHB depolymerase family esterase [Aquabacterium sp. J223]
MKPSTFVAKTLRRAFRSAGLHRPGGSGASVHTHIERALTAAGLAVPATGTVARPPARPAEPTRVPGRFLDRRYTGPQGSRDYKLYIPSSHTGRPAPLVLMLHGCKQNPDDFAAGTAMNAQAERHGFLVAYPAQTSRANGSNCWNWFEPAEQTRDGAEPAILAGIVDHVAAAHPVQPGQVFVAGLSAGAAMAVILGAAYPDVFSAVAAHSGLPLGAAHDVPSAFAAMHGRPGPTPRARPSAPVRTIVFHGDADRTVTLRNGTAIVEQAVAAFEAAGRPLQSPVIASDGHGGRTCEVTTYLDATGRAAIEAWRVEGAGHAWSGGSAAGSYTDTTGPDASKEIVRFFLGA